MNAIADVPAYDTPFDQSEYDDRLDRLRREMEENRLDGLILTEPSDIFYLSGYDTQGFWAYQAMIIPADGPLTLVCFVEEVLHAEARGLLHAGYAFGGDHIRMTVETIEKCGLGNGRIGVDTWGRYLPVGVFQELERSLSAELVDIAGMAERQRLVKSPAEVAYIREAAAISNEVMGRVYDALRIGINDREIASILGCDSIRLGSDYFAMGPFVRFGPTMVEGHLTWQGRTFEPGHVAELEVAAVRRRYNAPILRYAVAGPIEGDLAVCAEAVQLGMEAVREATRPGAVGSEVRQAAYEVGTDHLRRNGVEATYLPGGYSVGIGYPPDWTEADIITASSNYVLQPNVLFHFVSFFQLPESRIGTSDVVLVTEDGCEFLNTLQAGPIALANAG